MESTTELSFTYFPSGQMIDFKSSLFSQSERSLFLVPSRNVFDVGGNKVRAITKIQFGVQIILVNHVLTHEEYDKDKWRE